MKSQNDEPAVATLDDMSLEAREKLVMEKADDTTRRLEESWADIRKKTGKNLRSKSNNAGILSDLFNAVKWW